MTTKPSERIVVFVTPAQKLAISKTADNLGISVSELMRRAVLNFNATSEQIKAAAREAREAAANAAKNAGKSPATRVPDVTPSAKTPDTTDQSDHDDAADSGEDAWLTGGRRS